MNSYDKGYIRGRNDGILESLELLIQSIKKLDKDIDRDVLIETLETTKTSTETIIEGLEGWID